MSQAGMDVKIWLPAFNPAICGTFLKNAYLVHVGKIRQYIRKVLTTKRLTLLRLTFQWAECL